MSSPFQKMFSAKTPGPLQKHKPLERKLKKAEAGKIGAEQGDKDYELIAKLESQIKEAKANHQSTRREDDTQVKEDEDAARGSAAEMSPLNGYADGEERADHYKSTADLYQNMFDSIGGAVSEVKNDYMVATGKKLPKKEKDENNGT